MTDSVLCEHEGAVATITLNHPEARNALTVGVKTRLLAELRRCESDEGIRAVILTGAGRAFCAGQDLREHADLEREREQHLRQRTPRAGDDALHWARKYAAAVAWDRGEW